MRLDSVELKGFKRFTETTIEHIPETARLVVLAGPNGCGKSSLFDAFRTWHAANGGLGFGWDESYGTKVGSPAISWPEHVKLVFHGGPPPAGDGTKKAVYIRSAFRNEADFQVNNFSRMNSPLDSPRVARLVDNDISVSDNFQRLVMQTIDGVFDSEIPDNVTKGELRDRIIGAVRDSMSKVFPDLTFAGVGGIGSTASTSGTFFFDKGTSKGFLYKNLSAGEKAAFDLILDATIKREYYDDSIWCIDEPETHLNTRVQGLLLQTLMEIVPDRCQLFVATHSLGFMRKAWEMAQVDPGAVAFLDLQGEDFDESVFLRPVLPTRDFWSRTLDVALGDLATLVAPEHIVLCEGRPPKGQNDRKAEFDASCYRKIFAGEFPGTDFISVGNSLDASTDRLELGSTIKALVSGTMMTRLIDRDDRSEAEVVDLRTQGLRVLSRRHIEAYLLDDEVIRALCEQHSMSDMADQALELKRQEIEKATREREKASDDIKSSAGLIYVGLRRLLNLTKAGSDWSAFARDTLAPLLTPDMPVYRELRADIFE